MSIIPDTPTPSPPIENTVFFPPIDIAAFRRDYRIDSAIDDDAARTILKRAIVRANRELDDFVGTQIADGYATLHAVPSDNIDNMPIIVFHYIDAVSSLAKSYALETFADTDTTVVGDTDTALKSESSSIFKRKYREAIAAIKGAARADVELI